MGRFLPLLLLLLGTLPDCQAQTCLDCLIRHPQQDFCANDFVLKGKVKSSADATSDYEEGTEYRSHEVTVWRWFKRPEGVSKSSKIVVLNGKGDQACGSVIEEGKMYLIVGSYNATENVFHIPMCSLYTSEWQGVASGVKQKLKKKQYLKNCNCGVKMCEEVSLLNIPIDPTVTKEECLASGDNFCTTDTLNGDAFCRLDLSYCARDKAGKCMWEAGRAFKKCKAEK